MNEIIVFTDGSSRGNPGPGGWGSIVIDKENNTVTELGGREDHTTNNRMELSAVISALDILNNSKEIKINTDSSYVINGITKWVNGWKRNGWITKTKEDVINRDLWEKLVNASEGKEINWNYVGGHSGIVGNERCDEIATSFADNIEIKLYKGSLSDYNIQNIFDLSKSIEKSAKKSHSKAQAFSYISMVDGKIEIHRTWAECEARVKGKSNTKYRKSISKENEEQIISEFKKYI